MTKESETEEKVGFREKIMPFLYWQWQLLNRVKSRFWETIFYNFQIHVHVYHKEHARK